MKILDGAIMENAQTWIETNLHRWMVAGALGNRKNPIATHSTIKRIVFSSWSPCSRTCGGGIRNSKRHCDSPTPENGGEYCNGPSIRYESCATADCDINSPEFRAVQCAEYNGNSMSIPNITNDVEWIPQYGSGAYQ